MRIYTKSVWQMTADGLHLVPAECESFDYDGPIAECKGKGSKPPPSPDPNVVSAAQTQSNQQTAAYNAALNRGNTYTPLGSSTYESRGTDPTTGAPIFDQRISLDPKAQELYDLQLQQNLDLGSVSQGMLGRVGDTYGTPMDTSGAPALRDAPQMGGYQGNLNLDKYTGTFSPDAYQREANVNGPDLVGSLNTSNLPQLYGADDLQGARQQTQDALYGRQAAYLDPQWQQRESAERTRLANMGVVEGSEAFNNAMGDLSRARSFDYGQARNSAIAGGGDELSRLVNIAQGNRGQMFGEAQAGGQFTNAARNQALAEALSRGNFANQATGAQNADALAAGQFANQTTEAGNRDALAAGQFANQATEAGNRDALAAAGFGNQARAQGLNELFALRSQPLNEFNALRSAAPVDMPQFSGAPTVSMNPTDVAGNIYRSYQGDLDIWNAQQSGQNSLLSGLFNMGGQLGGAAIQRSDARLKTDIVRLGTLPQGVGYYEYSFRDDPTRHRGVMAQELQAVQPDAVLVGDDGYLLVDYAKVAVRALQGSVA